MKTEVQCRKVLEYIQEHGSITQRDANTIGVGRLSARVWDFIHLKG